MIYLACIIMIYLFKIVVYFPCQFTSSKAWDIGNPSLVTWGTVGGHIPFRFHFAPRHQCVLSTPWGAHTQATFNFPGLAAQDDHVSFKFAFFVKCFRVHHLPIMARFDHVWSCLIINGCRMRIGSHWQVRLRKTMVILPSGALIWANKSRILKWKRWYFCGWSTVLSIIWGEVTLRSPHFTQKLNSKGFKGMCIYIYRYIWTEREGERERETSQMHPIPGPLCPIMGGWKRSVFTFIQPLSRRPTRWSSLTSMKALLPHSLW